MSDAKTISMITCPYCDEEWVREDTELVCENCIPALNVDMAVGDLVNGMATLEQQAPVEVRARLPILLSLHHKLTAIIKKANPKPGADDVDATGTPD